MTTEANLIQTYLDNPEQAYQDWYAGLIGADTEETAPYAALPSLDTLKERFQVWYENHRDELYQLICLKWGYFQKKHLYQHKAHLIAAIVADVVALIHLIHPPHISVTVTLLAAEGMLDKLCESCPTPGE